MQEEQNIPEEDFDNIDPGQMIFDLEKRIRMLQYDNDRLIGNDLRQEKEIEALQKQVGEYRKMLQELWDNRNNTFLLNSLKKTNKLLNKYPQP